jgi:hypothetical protein
MMSAPYWYPYTYYPYYYPYYYYSYNLWTGYYAS